MELFKVELCAVVGMCVGYFAWRFIIYPILKRIFYTLYKCKHCNGEKFVHFDGEDIWDECEHCKTATKQSIKK